MSKQQAKVLERKIVREISQKEIEDYFARQLKIATLKRELKVEEEVHEVMEKAYVTMLERGFKSESGDLRLALDITSRSVTPKYKELLAQALGPKAIEQAQRDAGMKEYKHVSVVSTKVGG